MIRDPSDGSVKPDPDVPALKAKHGENWGLKSLDKPERKPKPAPTVDELRDHYSKFKLAFQPREAE